MRIELSQEVNSEMYLLDCKTGSVATIDVVRESKSGETVETASGTRYRTNAKNSKVFFDYKFALIGRMQALGQTDSEEYGRLLSKFGLRGARS